MFEPPMDNGPSSEKEATLEYLRAEFGPGWEPVLIYDEGMSDASDPLGWRVEMHHVSNGAYFVGTYSWDPNASARACVEAWREATAGTPSALRALVEKSFNAGWRMGGEMEPGAYADRILSLPGAFLLDGFRDQLNEANAQLKAESEHADRLAEALRQYVDKWAHVIAPAEYHEKSEAALAAHDARRSPAEGSHD